MEEDTKVRSFMPAEVGLEDDSIAMLAEKSKAKIEEIVQKHEEDVEKKFNSMFITAIEDYGLIENEHQQAKNIIELFGDLVGSIEDVVDIGDRYHGPSARRRFFTRYRWHGQQRNITHSEVDAPTEAMVFDNEGDKKNEFPFSGTTDPLSDLDSDDESIDTSVVTDAAAIMHLDSTSVVSFDSRSTSRLPPLRRLSKYKSQFPDPGTVTTKPLSPRTKYLDNCLRARLNPRASLIVRKKATTHICLKSHGIGDAMARSFADSLRDLPMVKSIDISDNNLTDVGLGPLLKALVSIPTLEELDISYNDVDEVSAECLATYIADPECPLKRLVMRRADVDDLECARFIECLHTNKNLTSIDMSNNILGSSENLNTVMPDLTTGAEALAELLSSPECILRYINVAWNMIRLDGAIAMAKSLSVNESVTYLDLSFNTFGHDGGLALGDAIIGNRTLQTLLLNNNNIDSTACFTICVGVIENLAISRLSLNGNPVGEQGAKALMLVPITVGQRVKVSASGCNLMMKDSKCWFDMKNPCTKYTLSMEHPFERAVAYLILRIVATHPTYIFNSFNYQPPGGRPESLDLIQSLSTEKALFLEGEKKEAVQGLLNVIGAADDRTKAFTLFNETDTDGSGELDADELHVLMEKIGIQMDPELIHEAIRTVDVDGGGTMGLSEFNLLLKSLKRDAMQRLNDLTQEKVMSLSSNPNIKYLPPKTGVITCEIVDGLKTKPNFHSISSVENSFVQEVAASSDDASLLLQHSTLHAKLRLAEAFNIYKMMMRETNNKAKVLMCLLPQVANTFEAKQLVIKATQGDKQAFLGVRLALGFSVKPIFGNVNGYYCLDMTREMDRLCFSQLLEKSRTLNGTRQVSCKFGVGMVGDTSQRGNWSCFRNEMFNRKPIEITLENFTPMPLVGKLEFDYSTIMRPDGDHEDICPIKDERFVRLLLNLKIVNEFDIYDCLTTLRQHRENLNATNEFKKKSQYECDREKAFEVSLVTESFYENLATRAVEWQDSREAERIRISTDNVKKMKKKKQPPPPSSAASAAPTGSTTPSKSREKLSSAKALDASLDNTLEELSHGHGDVNTEEAPPSAEEIALLESINEVVNDSSQPNTAAKPSTTSDLGLLAEIMASAGLSSNAKCVKMNEAIEDLTSRVYLLCKHVALLVEKYTIGKTKKTEHFGSYRVEIVLELFPRILDIHNFEVVLYYLDAYEVGCLWCRLGILNMLNPLKPEGCWEFHMKNREERLACKVFCALAVIEPGLNWPEKELRWKREMDPTPGWDLPATVMTEESFYPHGIIFLKYYSGECQGRHNCRPKIDSRKAMLNLVLSEEKDIFDFEDADEREHRYHDLNPVVHTDGLEGMRSDETLWRTFLATPNIIIPNDALFKEASSRPQTGASALVQQLTSSEGGEFEPLLAAAPVVTVNSSRSAT